MKGIVRIKLGRSLWRGMLERSAVVSTANRAPTETLLFELQPVSGTSTNHSDANGGGSSQMAVETTALRSKQSAQTPVDTASRLGGVETTALRSNGSLSRRTMVTFARFLHHPTAPTQLDVLEGYARWAASYEQDMDGHPLALAESAAMGELLPPCKGQIALDAACGTGRYARLLAERGARQVIGVDQSAAMLARAQASGPARWPGLQGVFTFIQGDLRALPLAEASCDLAIVALALAHLETSQLARAFAELRRVLRPGGVLLMSEMHPIGALTGGRCRFEQSNGNSRQVFHIQTHTHLHEDYLAAADAAGFHLEALREPRLLPDLFPAFERAGMGAFARQHIGFPLALVCRWRVDDQGGSSV